MSNMRKKDPPSGRGGARPGAGRKPGVRTTNTPRGVQKAQRYTEKEARTIAGAAEHNGETESEFIRNAALYFADNRIIREAHPTAASAFKSARLKKANMIMRLDRINNEYHISFMIPRPIK